METGGPIINSDAYAPAEMAKRVEAAGIKKATMPLLQTIVLGVLAGVFISFGAMLYTLVMTGNELGFGPGRWLGGIAFSLGLILVLIGGAELFTGNALITMAWADKKVTTSQLMIDWVVVYIANFVGAIACVVLVLQSGILELGNMGATAASIAAGKTALEPFEAFVRGILCNALVCLAVWLCFAARDVAGKILAIIFPISAFVALGFEHSVANMYLIPVGMFASAIVDIPGLFANLIPVTLGNIVGGAGGVALVYWAVYLRPAK